MPPRYLQRMQRQSDVLRDVFGDPQNDPPPYPFSPSRSGSSSSSFQYRRSADLSAYQGRLSQDSASTASASGYHRRQSSNQTSASSLQYSQSADAGSEATDYNFPPPPGYSPKPIDAGLDISALPRDALVLVTAASSFQGLHVVDQLLRLGIRVRGTVRDAEKAVWTAKLFRDRYGAGRFTTAVIPDMAAQHAFDLAIRGCSGVVHVASVTKASEDPNEVITPSIAGAVNALEAAAKEAGVRRVVVTSCASAAVSHDRSVRNVVSGDSWNMLDFEDAWAPNGLDDGDGLGVVKETRGPGSRIEAIRACAKMQAEQAAWKWYWDRRPHFVLNTVLPDTLFGAPLAPTPSSEHLPPSIALLSSLFNPHTARSHRGPSCGHFVNPSDSAALHLAALLLPDVRNERIFAVSIPWTCASLRQALLRLFPGKFGYGGVRGGGTMGAIAEDDEEDEAMDLTVFKDVERAEMLLRRMGRSGWRDLEGSLRGAVEGFL